MIACQAFQVVTKQRRPRPINTSAFLRAVETSLRLQPLFKHLLPLIFGIMVPLLNTSAQSLKGLRPGAKAPDIHLKDEHGRQQTLATLSGPNGLLLLFFRSADWCPFCKGQLVDLQGTQKAFAAKGINVAGVSYDSVAILADFAKRRSITYPLLSDTSSSLIDAFGIRNPEGTGTEAGIPYPGYYLIGRNGVIQKRFFETAYVNRLTASNLYRGSCFLCRGADEQSLRKLRHSHALYNIGRYPARGHLDSSVRCTGHSRGGGPTGGRH